MSKKSAYYFLFACSSVLVDQITKLIFSNRDFFVGALHFHSVKNYGLSFAVNFGVLLNLILIGAGLVFFIYYYVRHRHEMSVLHHSAFALIFAGAISNIIDRLARGFVIDFLDLGLGFTFNLADVFIAVGLIMLLLPQNNGDKITK